MADLTRKTANLFDGDVEQGTWNAQITPIVKADSSVRCRVSNFIDVAENTQYTISLVNAISVLQIIVVYVDDNYSRLSETTWLSLPITFNTPTKCKYVEAIFRKSDDANIIPSECGNMMLNSGSTPLPYEPYDWVHSLRKLTTATEAIENPLYSDGTAITAYTIKGNTVQSGTPTPSNPVDVNGVGVMTENLFDATIEQGSISPSGDIPADNRVRTREFINVESGYITLSWNSSQNIEAFIMMYDVNGDYVGSVSTWVTSPTTLQISSIIKKIRMAWRYNSQADISPSAITNIMLNVGQTALPYEPYGYKIPISSGGKNLFDMEAATDSAYINSLGEIAYNDAWSVSDYIFVESLTTYTISRITDQSTTAACHAFYDANKSLISTIQAEVSTRTFETPANAKYIRCSWRSTTIQQVMLNKGSTPLPYEPYNRTTTSVYLGSTQTVRQIYKFVFDGRENWSNQIIGQTCAVSIRKDELPLSPNMPERTLNILSTHFKAITNSANFNIGEMIAGSSYLNFNYDGTNNLADFKDYLTTQYANGTPVTIWYVLATAETAAVNEPLMKIGDYADTLSNATAIPTTEGANTITVDTTVQPSEFSATWTGWHDASVKEKSENLVDESKVTPNTYIGGSGETGSSASSNLTDYIDINESPFVISGVIIGSIQSANNRAICFYDSDKNFISSIIYSPNVMTSPALISDIPQNAKYVRFAFDKAFENGIMLNTGSTALPYEPYWK